MAHEISHDDWPHTFIPGPPLHTCYCPNCNNYSIEAGPSVVCALQECPQCRSRLKDRGEEAPSIAQQAGSLMPINDQPVAASFFGQGGWLTDFVTPNASDVQDLYKSLTKGLTNSIDKITACAKWVANQVRYVQFVKGKIWIEGKSSVQTDLWTYPSMTIKTRVGNCAVKSFLLTSLLRNELPANEVYCTLGNLYNGKPGGHAWVALKLPEGEQIMETTVPSAPPMVSAEKATRYESVHYFNDEEIYAVEGRTQLVPMAAVYSTWLGQYLNWLYIKDHQGT
jgi:hypothetical protein